MTRWRISAIAGLLAAGLAPAAMAATATVYYSTATKGWPTANIHHNASGTWTTVPGMPMTAACPGWLTTTVTFSATNFQAVFNNGANVWDNPTGGGNYTVPAGIHQVRNGAIVANAGYGNFYAGLGASLGCPEKNCTGEANDGADSFIGSSQTSVPVPDGGSTATLLGSALVAFGMLRRKLRK